MLKLTRQVDEKIMIGENVTVMVSAVKGSQIRIGVDAPREIQVNREEIYQRNQTKQEELDKTRRIR